MTRTLADMTPQEREACKGMWCEFVDFDDSDGYERSTGSSRPRLGILIGNPDFDDEYEVIAPALDSRQFSIPAWEITPRFDLPRAWGADGEPVKGEWEDDECRNLQRRFVHDWEAKP